MVRERLGTPGLAKRKSVLKCVDPCGFATALLLSSATLSLKITSDCGLASVYTDDIVLNSTF